MLNSLDYEILPLSWSHAQPHSSSLTGKRTQQLVTTVLSVLWHRKAWGRDCWALAQAGIWTQLITNEDIPRPPSAAPCQSQTLKHWSHCWHALGYMTSSPQLPIPLSITTANRSEPNFLLSQWGLGFLHFWQLEHCRLFFKTKQTDSLRIMGLKWGTADVAQ